MSSQGDAPPVQKKIKLTFTKKPQATSSQAPSSSEASMPPCGAAAAGPSFMQPQPYDNEDAYLPPPRAKKGSKATGGGPAPSGGDSQGTAGTWADSGQQPRAKRRQAKAKDEDYEYGGSGGAFGAEGEVYDPDGFEQDDDDDYDVLGQPRRTRAAKRQPGAAGASSQVGHQSGRGARRTVRVRLCGARFSPGPLKSLLCMNH